MELKTNEDGKAIIDVIPIGDTVRLQVIAKGFQTYGQDYKIDKSDMSMEVRLKRPGEQYSIYKNNNGSGSSDKGTEKPEGRVAFDASQTEARRSRSSKAHQDAAGRTQVSALTT